MVFIGLHSIRIVAGEWRSARIAARGERAWKGPIALGSLVGLALIVWGYSMARKEPVLLWTPPSWAPHLAALLVLLSFILLAATYIPRNHLKAAIGHPMYAGIKLCALAHLLSNGTLADLLLFGSFLLWAVAGFSSGRARDRRAGVAYPAGAAGQTTVTVLVGIVAWAIFAFYLHAPLIGVRPLG